MVFTGLLEVQEAIRAVFSRRVTEAGRGFRRCNGIRITSLLVLHIAPLLIKRGRVVVIVIFIVFTVLVILIISLILLVRFLGHSRKARQVVLLEDLNTSSRVKERLRRRRARAILAIAQHHV